MLMWAATVAAVVLPFLVFHADDRPVSRWLLGLIVALGLLIVLPTFMATVQAAYLYDLRIYCASWVSWFTWECY